MLPLKKGQRSEDIRLAKDRINETFGTKLDLEGNNREGALYDQALKDAVIKHLIHYTGDKSGKNINANIWNGLLRDFIIKVAPTQPVTGVTTAQVTRMIRDTRLLP